VTVPRRPTAAELHAAAGERLKAKLTRWRPRCLAVLGVGAYRSAFGRPKAGPGRQPHNLSETLVWVLPNPSGLNAHYQPADLARL
jgi:TDG/mug DNA glycosylase family protein